MKQTQKRPKKCRTTLEPFVQGIPFSSVISARREKRRGRERARERERIIERKRRRREKRGKESCFLERGCQVFHRPDEKLKPNVVGEVVGYR
jgi:hypothetical protein